MASSSGLKDQATALIGQYLLQGYCMLASHCPECGTVLLRKKDKSETCVLCNEILPLHVTKTGKDEREQTEQDKNQPITSTNQHSIGPSIEETSPSSALSLAHTQQVLLSKITSATRQLEENRSVEYDIQLCHLITSCIKTLKELNEFCALTNQ